MDLRILPEAARMQAIEEGGEAMTDCTTCAERQGYYLDAETIASQQEHIAELERDRDYWRNAFCEQAGDTLTLDSENAELKSLVRDMDYCIRNRMCCDDCGIRPCRIGERMKALGLLGGDAE